MLGAASADDLYLFPQGLAGAMHTNIRIVGCDAAVFRELGDRMSFDVYGPQRFLVFGFQFREHVVHTLADLVSYKLHRLPRNVETIWPLFKESRGGFSTAIVIDYCIAEHPVEPGDNALLVSKGRSFLHPTNEGRLQDVLGDGAGLDALFEESKKVVATRE